MTNQPLVVYLDASDVSRFADSGTIREQPAIRNVYEKLQWYLECGMIQIRFSSIHIAEIAKSGSKELAHNKAQVIEQLCGNFCFRPFDEIWKREVWSLVQSCAAGPRFAIPYKVESDDGLWLLHAADMKLDLDAEIKKALKQAQLNHSQRRALKASIWQRDRLTQRGVELLKPHWLGTGGDIAKRFPVYDTTGITALAEKLLCGGIAKHEFQKDFLRLLLRPTQMVRFIYEIDEIRQHCPAFVVEMGERLVRMVSDLRVGLNAIPQLQRRQVGNHLTDTLVRKPAAEAALRDRHRVRGAKLSDKKFEEIVYGAKPGELPAIDLISKAARAYATQHATMPRNPEESDGADFMHLTYLPYCDIFRADTYMVELLKQCGVLVSAAVARRLAELPAEIERLMCRSQHADRLSCRG